MLHMLQWQYTHVASLCFKCFMCFRHLFQNFHPDVSKVDLVLHMLQWLYTHVSSISSIFRRMLQLFHLDVLKVDLVSQPPSACWWWCAAVIHMPVPKACRRLHGVHPQAGQATGTDPHVHAGV